MKKLLMMLMVLAVLAMTGCGIPPGVRASLYTAQATLHYTVEDAAAGTKPLWNVPEDATDKQKLALRKMQVDLLLNTMDQADKNLEAVVDYFRTGKERKDDG